MSPIEQYLLFLLLGLGTGALFAALSQGIVLAYRGSGVINFSHGAMAVYVAYTYAELRGNSRLLLPPIPNPLAPIEGVANRFFGQSWDLPNWPTFLDLPGEQWAFVPAFVLSLVVGAGLGLLLHLLVFRPLRHAPVLAKVVAAVGVMLVLQSIVSLRFGGDAKSVDAILPTDGLEIFGGTVGYDRIILAGLAVVSAAVLWALFKYTRFGLATRAAAENEKGATLLGYSPEFQAGVNWMLSAVVAGIFGVLASPITALTPTNFTLFIIPALGAALLASFTSFWVATIAGVVMGMVDQLFVLLLLKWEWLPDYGMRQAFPFIVIIVAMFLRGKALPTRGTIGGGRLPFAPTPRYVPHTAVILVSLVTVGLLVLPFGYRNAIMNSLTGVVISLSLVVLVGFVGQISLAQLSIAGFAAFALTRITGEWGIPFPIGPVLAALAATVLGVLIGIPALRARGVNLAVITLAFAYTLDEMVFNNPNLTGVGGQGAKAPPPSLFGIEFGPLSPFFGNTQTPTAGFGLFLLVVVTLMALAVVNLRRSSTGRRLLAVRSNERAAAAAGVSVVRTKMNAFALSSFIAGIGGTLIAYKGNGVVSAPEFAVLLSVSALATAYLGGISSVSGAIFAGSLALGGISFYIGQQLFHAGRYETLVSGIGLVLTAVLNPEGISGAMRAAVHEVRHKRAARHHGGAAAPAPVGDQAPVAVGGGS